MDKLPGRILSCDKFSHFSIKIGNNMTHIDFNLTVILIYILLVNHRHTLLTLNMRGYAVILILFLRFGRQKFTSTHILTRSPGHVPMFTSVHENDCRTYSKLTPFFPFHVHCLSISVDSVLSQGHFQRSADFSDECLL